MEENQAVIILRKEGEEEVVFPLGDQMSIGRSKKNQLYLSDSKASRYHAEIRLLGGIKYRLTDLGSVNGTWLNGRRVTSPRDLLDGDEILIGTTKLQFRASPGVIGSKDPSTATGTASHLRNESVIVLVSDIREYGSMSEALPEKKLSQLIKDWFATCTAIIEKNGGNIDKFIGDAVMAYWIVPNENAPQRQTHQSLKSAKQLIAGANAFSKQISAIFPGYSFRVGIGISMGNALMGNIGDGEHQSFTIVGDTVNLAFRFESLTKEKQTPIIVGRNIADSAGGSFHFRDLGMVAVKGRKEPSPISAFIID